MRRVNPMTTKASARQPIPPSRVDSGVDPPATAATPPVLSCMAMPGESTETLIAIASMVRNCPLASWPTWASASPGSALLICAALRSSPEWWWSCAPSYLSWSTVVVVPVSVECRARRPRWPRSLLVPDEGGQSPDPLVDGGLVGPAVGQPDLVAPAGVGVEGRTGHVGDAQACGRGRERARVDVLRCGQPDEEAARGAGPADTCGHVT